MTDYRVRIIVDGTDNASDELRTINNNLAQMDQKATSASGGFGGIGTAIGGIVTAWGAFQVGQKVLELNDLGMAANRAANTFEALSGGALASQASLNALRSVTHGVVDDVTLMEGANRLLMMGLAGSNAEAAELVGLATTLGTAMGQDAATAVQDFAALLANQSIPRLDNFGISSARVRQRIQELQDAVVGMSREEAFTLAVLEEGSIAVDRLGSSVMQNVTAFDMLKTNITNARNELGGMVAQALEAGAQLILIPGMLADIRRERDALLAAEVDEMVADAGPLGTQIARTDAETDDVLRSYLTQIQEYEQVFGRVPSAMEISDYMGYGTGEQQVRAFQEALNVYTGQNRVGWQGAADYSQYGTTSMDQYLAARGGATATGAGGNLPGMISSIGTTLLAGATSAATIATEMARAAHFSEEIPKKLEEFLMTGEVGGVEREILEGMSDALWGMSDTDSSLNPANIRAFQRGVGLRGEPRAGYNQAYQAILGMRGEDQITAASNFAALAGTGYQMTGGLDQTMAAAGFVSNRTLADTSGIPGMGGMLQAMGGDGWQQIDAAAQSLMETEPAAAGLVDHFQLINESAGAFSGHLETAEQKVTSVAEVLQSLHGRTFETTLKINTEGMPDFGMMGRLNNDNGGVAPGTNDNASGSIGGQGGYGASIA